MIKAENLTKKFNGFRAVSSVSCEIPKGCIYGLIGSNGAGKSTFLRLITGVYKADEGGITLDGEPVYENPVIKRKLAYVPDELYFLANSSMKRMASLYSSIYADFDNARFMELTELFKLNPKVNINTFSKGMRRQAATILALCTNPEYIFFDETFDGLDPVVRNLVKNLITQQVLDRGTTAIITSHSLRELEDTCDQLALLYQGGIVFESDVQNLKTSLFKIQVAFLDAYDQERFEGLDILNFSKKGSVSNFIVRGDRERTKEFLETKSPVLLDILPLSLEEVFIYEMQALGYAFENILEEDKDVQL
ncbi:MAG: ABC transporter ATP-binding protein [Oscillospiraceae bacterium]|nr:ABC transporter ATP-binding protein [Oscillospiraceae bacterium]